MFRAHFERIVKDQQKGILERISESQKELYVDSQSQEEFSADKEMLLEREMRGITKSYFYKEDRRSK